MRRYCFICAVLCATVAVSGSALWVRSFWTHDIAEWLTGEHSLSFDSLGGRVVVAWRHNPRIAESGLVRGSSPRVLYSLSEEFERTWLGFGFKAKQLHYRDGQAITVRKVMARHDAFIIVALGLSVWLWLRSAKQARALRAKQCVKCGYDLSATASKICSECGAQRPEI